MAYVEVSDPRPHVRQITLNRPERMNAMSFDTIIPLREALEAAGHDNDCWVVILTGNGDGFCSGLDLEDAGVPPHADGLTLSRLAIRAMEYFGDIVPQMRKLPQPVIGAVNGPAIGGGMCLSMGTDIRIAGESAYWRAAGINNGLGAVELGLSWTLSRAIGVVPGLRDLPLGPRRPRRGGRAHRPGLPDRARRPAPGRRPTSWPSASAASPPTACR